MELRPGYKQTDVGMIPEEWTVVPFSELLEFRNGVNADKHAYGKGIPFINVLEVITKAHLRAADIPGRVSLSTRTGDSFAVRWGDLVFNRTSETQEEVGLSSVYLDDAPVVFGGFVIRGRPTCDALDPVYSGYAFRAPAVRAQIIAKGQGAIRANVGQSDLRQVLAPLPLLPEQRAIAGALGDVDALLGALTQLIAKKRDLKQAAMQQLLTGQTRLPGFSGEREAVTAGQIGRFRGGNGFPLRLQGRSEGLYPFYKVSDMNTEGNDTFMTASNNWISEPVRKSLGATPFPANSIVFAKVGAAIFLERKKILTQASCIDNNMTAFVLNPDRADCRFGLYLFLNTKLAAQAATTALPSLNGKQLSELPFALPPLAEQIAIAAVLSDMNVEISALEQRLAKTRALKQGMMQELLTGKTRLI